jgi:hypothetical protein
MNGGVGREIGWRKGDRYLLTRRTILFPGTSHAIAVSSSAASSPRPWVVDENDTIHSRRGNIISSIPCRGIHFCRGPVPMMRSPGITEEERSTVYPEMTLRYP